ncbi:hypothetical protein KR084_011754 [Drosophila pseudotakahashii]|nr:hypothetical protein KR084_011754 [Drosophila pseudotakahashii]
MCRIKSISPNACTRFYAIWCITWGLLIGCGYALLLFMDLLRPKAKLELIERIISIAYALMGLSYALAGAFMFSGMEYVSHWCQIVFIYLCSTNRSSFIFTHTMFVHCCSMRCMCQYMKERWNKG